ncbi:MAG: ABC transporter ATP-binding protein [Pseudomonadota bacterium]
MSHPPLLEIDRARVCRGGVTVFESLSLVVNNNEAVAVIGPNGAGKSTLAGLLMRDYYPVYCDPASVRIHGKSRFAIAEYRDAIGLVANDALRWLSPETTVGAACRAANTQISARLLDRFGLAPLVDRPIAELSDGERRRVILARALARSPDVLVLDEPFTHLDPASTAQLLDLLRDNVIGRMALLLITHRLSEIPPEIDRVVGLRNGTVMFDGAKREHLDDATMQTLYGTPLHVLQSNGWFTAVPAS